jgi:tetratricopeptide (TPR) repeat protein
MKQTIKEAFKYAVKHHKDGNIQEAERLYRLILKSNPEHADANHNLGVIGASVNKADVALPFFRAAIKTNPNIEQYWVSYIEALIIMDDLDSAKEALVEAQKNGTEDRIISSLQAQIASRPKIGGTYDLSQAQSNELLTHYNEGRFEEAAGLARAYTQDLPENPFGWKILGAALWQMGEKKDALEANRREVSISPLDAEAHNNLGNTLRGLGELHEAEASCRHALKLKFDYAEAHLNLGSILSDLGKLKEAEHSYRDAIKVDPRYAVAHNALGLVLQKSNELAEAEMCFRRALALTTGFIEAHQNLTKILRQTGETIKAEESSRFVKYVNWPISGEDIFVPDLDPTPFSVPRAIEYPMLYREGMGTENVGPFLRSMVQMLRPTNILEVGAGYTTPFLLEALVNNERVYDDGNLDAQFFKNYKYDPKLVIIDNMALGELKQKPGMRDILQSKYTEFIEGNFQGRAKELADKFGSFDFVWYDCGGQKEYECFMDEYWNICSDYVFFHFTYSNGNPNIIHDIILQKIEGSPAIFDIVEPHKRRQGSITMVNKNYRPALLEGN